MHHARPAPARAASRAAAPGSVSTKRAGRSPSTQVTRSEPSSPLHRPASTRCHGRDSATCGPVGTGRDGIQAVPAGDDGDAAAVLDRPGEQLLVLLGRRWRRRRRRARPGGAGRTTAASRREPLAQGDPLELEAVQGHGALPEVGGVGLGVVLHAAHRGHGVGDQPAELRRRARRRRASRGSAAAAARTRRRSGSAAAPPRARRPGRARRAGAASPTAATQAAVEAASRGAGRRSGCRRARPGAPGATNASGRSASTVASVNWPGYWMSAWSSWRSVNTTGSRRSGTGSGGRLAGRRLGHLVGAGAAGARGRRRRRGAPARPS